MSTINTKDGTEIYYKDWGTRQAVVGHGWPLNAGVWDGHRWHIRSRYENLGTQRTRSHKGQGPRRSMDNVRVAA